MSGCITPTTVLQETSLRDELQGFLDTRAAFLDARDVDGFLASGSAAAQAFEAPIASGALAAPVTNLALRLDHSSLRQREATLTGVEVDLIYHYEGLPGDNAFRIPLLYDFAQTAEGWLVTNARLKEGTKLPVWASEPVLSQTSEHFLALFRPELAAPDRILREAEEARAQLDGKITFELEDRYVLLLAVDDEDYRRMSGATLGPISAIAQVETSYEVTPDRIRVLGRQMILNSRRLHEDGEALETLRHELGHLAVAQYTRPFTPAWVSESAAMFLAGTRPVGIWRNGLSSGRFDAITIERLTRAANLGEHDSSREGASLEYAYSAAAAWYLVETFGPSRYWDFYRSYSEVPAQDLYDRLPSETNVLDGDAAIEALAVTATDAALHQHFSLDQAGLDREIRQWLTAQVA